MDCNYAFHPEHCGEMNGRGYGCPYHSVGEGPLCFCWPSLVNGVKLIHAYGRTFKGLFYKNFQPNFMQSLWKGFQEVIFELGTPIWVMLVPFACAQVPLDSAAVLERIQVLKGDFSKLPKQPPCFALTPEVLYRNAEEYLLKIILQDPWQDKSSWRVFQLLQVSSCT